MFRLSICIFFLFKIINIIAPVKYAVENKINHTCIFLSGLRKLVGGTTAVEKFFIDDQAEDDVAEQEEEEEVEEGLNEYDLNDDFVDDGVPY